MKKLMPKLKNISIQRDSTTEYNEDVANSIENVINFAISKLTDDQKDPTSTALKYKQMYDGPVELNNKANPNYFNMCDNKVLEYYGTDTKLTFLTKLKELHKNYFTNEWEKGNSGGASGSDILLLKNDKKEVIFVIKLIRKDEYQSMRKYGVTKENRIKFTIVPDTNATHLLNYDSKPTLLVPSLAYFIAKTDKSKELIHGVIMPGIEPPKYTMKFDLKGSLSGRIAKPKELKKGYKAILKDQNLFSKDTGTASIVAPGAYEWKDGDWSQLLNNQNLDMKDPKRKELLKHFDTISKGLDGETGKNIKCLQQSGIPHNSYAWRFINFMTYYVIGPLILSQEEMFASKTNWTHVFSQYEVKHPEQIKNLWTRLISDVRLLMDKRVMDYSLILYVTDADVNKKTNLFKIDITDPSNNNKEISIHIGIIDYYSYGPCPKNGKCGSTPTAQLQQRYDVDKSAAFKIQMLKKNVGLCASRKTAKSGPNKKKQPQKDPVSPPVAAAAAAVAAAAGGKKQKRKRRTKRRTKRRKNRRRTKRK